MAAFYLCLFRSFYQFVFHNSLKNKRQTDFYICLALCSVIPTGFEPVTHRLEICCSIQLSYGTVIYDSTKSGANVLLLL